MGGFEASTFIELAPGVDRGEVLTALNCGLRELHQLHGDTLLEAEVRPGPRERLIEAVLRLARWDDEVDEDFAATLLESAISLGLAMLHTGQSDPLEIRSSRFVAA